MTSCCMKRSNRYIVFDVVNALGYNVFGVMFPTTLNITESKLHYTLIIQLLGGAYIPFANKPNLLLYAFSAVRYKTFSLTVGMGCGPSIKLPAEGTFASPTN